MQLEHRRDMSVLVTPCTSYDFNALTPVVEVVALIRCMCFCISLQKWVISFY